MDSYKAQIIPINKPATDGSIFKRDVVERYLESAQYNFRKNTRTCLGSITHLYRDKKNVPSDIIAVSDQMLLSRVITHYVSEMHIEGGWLVGTIVLLNEDLFEGTTTYESIRFIKSLLKSGIEVPISATVLGNWSGNQCTEILDISGVDFTLEPGFDQARVLLKR
jgi:hypothetical protein